MDPEFCVSGVEALKLDEDNGCTVGKLLMPLNCTLKMVSLCAFCSCIKNQSKVNKKGKKKKGGACDG